MTTKKNYMFFKHKLINLLLLSFVIPVFTFLINSMLSTKDFVKGLVVAIDISDFTINNSYTFYNYGIKTNFNN